MGGLGVVASQRDVEAERIEFETVLNDVFSRPSNTKRMLCYICEKYFEGTTADIKEYSIAVDAFGRADDFDPTIDSIVRVEAHRLRSKLDAYYSERASDHHIRISLPHGGYVPQFTHRVPEESKQDSEVEVPPAAASDLIQTEDPGTSEVLAAALPRQDEVVQSPEPQIPQRRFRPTHLVAACVAFVALLAVLGWLVTVRRSAGIANKETTPEVSEAALITHPSATNSAGIRILAGTSFPGELNWDGNIWVADRYFSGGEAANTSQSAFDFSTTPALYNHRRRGTFSYAIPLRSGKYELKLHFADAYFGSGNPDLGGEASRLFDVKANGKLLLHDFDVISDAGGPNTADIKVFTDIEPAKDGYLHLDFIPNRNVPFVNGIELLPTVSKKMLPIRIYTGLNTYTDDKGVVWGADRYFRGGVHYHAPTSQAAEGDADVRFGNFVYQIPVADEGSYTARLRFCRVQLPVSETVEKEANVFSVFLNGRSLLDNFQLEPGASQPLCVVKEFGNLRPSAQGKLIFSFVPTSGYASVNSIAIDEQ